MGHLKIIIKNWKLFKHNLYYLFTTDIRKDLLDREYRIKDQAVEDCIYEFNEDNEILKKLCILDADQSIDKLLNEPKSFARFGDGEVAIINGEDKPFQTYNPLLAEKLRNLLNKSRDDIYIGINRSYFMSPFGFAEHNHRFYRLYGTDLRRFFVQNADPNAVYLEACCFGGYYRFDNVDYSVQIEKNKSVFRGRKIALVAGNGVFEKLEYNIFDEAADFMILHAPAKNAFDEYDNIIETVKKNVPKDWIVCLILGMTATALVGDLTDEGYIAWDIGHVAKDYDAYMHHYEKSEDNMQKFWEPD